MARLTPTVNRPSKDGTVIAMGAPTVDGDAIPPGALVLITNANAAVLTVTVDTPGTVGGLSIGQFTFTVANGTTELVGPFPEEHFRQTTGATKGLVHLDYSIQASVTRAVFTASS